MKYLMILGVTLASSSAFADEFMSRLIDNQTRMFNEQNRQMEAQYTQDRINAQQRDMQRQLDEQREQMDSLDSNLVQVPSGDWIVGHN